MPENIRQKIGRQLLTCEHGIDGDCYWCKIKQEAPTKEKIAILEDRFMALLDIMKMLISERTRNMTGVNSGLSTTTIIANSLISSGLDSAKPGSGTSLAFYYATDIDKIYQRRENSWIDISFSRPQDGDARITNIETDSATGTLEITDTA